MTESFILQLIPMRMTQLGYKKYHIRYRDIAVLPNSRIIIPAYNELWFIIDDPAGIRVESGYGVYDTTGELNSFDNNHQHRGEILILNQDTDIRRIKFVQAIIVN
ncbi:MAG: hypothetical protein JWO58_2838 [Chitinophagaceae bacterium]|nr:hypothetical protein [Chitinophagaceae bacterium]